MTIVEAAGPLGIPATVIHPDDDLPNTWRIVGTWEHQGERGAYVHAVGRDEEWRRYPMPRWAQLVYRADAKRYGRSHIGTALSNAAASLVCESGIGDQEYGPRSAASPPERLAYYAERGRPIHHLDYHARRIYHEVNGKPGPDGPFGGTRTPTWDDLPDPRPDDDVTIRKARDLCPAAFAPLRVHPAAVWPEGWERVTRGREEWAYDTTNPWPDWILIKVDPSVKLPKHSLSGTFRSWSRRLSGKVYMAEQGLPTTTAPHPAPAAAPVPAGPPPAPGVERVKWIGERIAHMVSRESSDYLPLTRRRIAAHRALSIVAGYAPEDAVNDGLLLSGSLGLHLEGLNAYAARVFAGQED